MKKSSKLQDLWQHISSRRKGHLKLLLVLLISNSLAEVISIGAIFPFLATLSAPEYVFEHAYFQWFIEIMGINNSKELLIPLTVVFSISIMLSGILRILMLYANTKLSYATGADLSISIFNKTLYQPYSKHISQNSSEIINAVTSKTHAVTNVLLGFLNIISSFIVLLSIVIALIMISPSVTFIVLFGFSFFYYIIAVVIKKRVACNSKIIAMESTNVVKSLQEGLGAIRDVIIDGSQKFYRDIYRDADIAMRAASASNLFMGISPRTILEAFGVLLITLVAYFVSIKHDSAGASEMTMPLLGTLALGAQRILPLLQQIYMGWNTIHGSKSALQDVILLLNLPLPEHADKAVGKAIPFNNKITLSNLSFRYDRSSKLILNNINIIIDKGSRVGIIGETGGGKSTLLDILMGLLDPTEGKIIIDNKVITKDLQRRWQARISHVPQHIYLVDGSIESNIAFGIPSSDMDIDRIKLVAEKAQLSELIESMPQKFKTIVGENGINLSGGQRQRIGIARALYKLADVLVFDEATSALDNKTEQLVMNHINDIDNSITVFIVAHRLSTLENCTQIIELVDGKIHKICSYNDILLHN